MIREAKSALEAEARQAVTPLKLTKCRDIALLLAAVVPIAPLNARPEV